jgi:hypothetical protein
MYDLRELWDKKISEIIFSLDQADPRIKYHPFNQMRFYPSSLYDKPNILPIFLLADYLLKIFTVYEDRQSEFPWQSRKIDQLISHLPPHLKKIITDFHENSLLHEDHDKVYRFWIEMQEVNVAESRSSNQHTVGIDDVRMVVKKHRMTYDDNGQLIDTPVDDEDDSPAGIFAKKFSLNYDKFALYFPQFARLREICKMLAAMKLLNKHCPRNLTKVAQPDLSKECLWVPANLHIEQSLWWYRCVYGGVSVIPKFNYLDKNSELAKYLIHQANFGDKNRIVNLYDRRNHSVLDKYTIHPLTQHRLMQKSSVNHLFSSHKSATSKSFDRHRLPIFFKANEIKECEITVGSIEIKENPLPPRTNTGGKRPPFPPTDITNIPGVLFSVLGSLANDNYLLHTVFPMNKLKQQMGLFIYVVTREGELIVHPVDEEKHKGKTRLGALKVDLSVGHADLASFKPVRAAGEVYFANGRVIWINNASGHYMPSGVSAKMAAEKAFTQLGFDVEGKYFEDFGVKFPEDYKFNKSNCFKLFQDETCELLNRSFECQFPSKAIRKFISINPLQIVRNKLNGHFLYVVTNKGLTGKLVMGNPELCSHSDLANNEPVRAAGWVRFENGIMTRINNISTDYYADGIHSRFAALRAFHTSGVDIDECQYHEKDYYPAELYEKPIRFPKF